jgi:hypothetical protein
MRSSASNLFLLILGALLLSGCAVVGGIFKTGMAVGIFIAVIIVILLFVLFGRK